jgi:hypothetical protein
MTGRSHAVLKFEPCVVKRPRHLAGIGCMAIKRAQGNSRDV